MARTMALYGKPTGIFRYPADTNEPPAAVFCRGFLVGPYLHLTNAISGASALNKE
jgi:hypothetical protein